MEVADLAPGYRDVLLTHLDEIIPTEGLSVVDCPSGLRTGYLMRSRAAPSPASFATGRCCVLRSLDRASRRTVEAPPSERSESPTLASGARQ